MGYYLNDIENMIISEVQLSNILLYFNINQTLDIIDAAIDNRYNSFVLVEPNVVDGFEADFKYLLSKCPGSSDEIMATREQTYITIIEHLESKFGFQFNEEYSGDLYSAASILYGIFVSTMRNNVINFFATFISREKKYLFDSLGLVNFKKDKDVSTAYNKKVQKDQKLAIICTYIDMVVSNICTYDVEFEAFLTNAGVEPSIKDFLLKNVAFTVDFFKVDVVKTLLGPTRNTLLSYICTSIKQISQFNDFNISNVE